MDQSHLKLSQEVDTLRETLTPIERESSEGQRWSYKMPLVTHPYARLYTALTKS